MNSNSLCLAALVLLVAACAGEGRAPQEVFDPHVPPSTPTVTNVATGFDAPQVQQPDAHPIAMKLGVNERLHYLPLPALAGISAGAHVDIVGLFPMQSPDVDQDGTDQDGTVVAPAAPSYVVITLLQNIRVADVREPEGDVVNVGLAVTIDELEMLLVSSTEGTLTALLRAPNHYELETIAQVTLREVVQDIEVLQEKRQIRRRKRGRTPASGKIDPDERGLVLRDSLPPGVLTTGAQVDIHGTFEMSRAEGGQVAMTLLQNVGVVAAKAGEVQLSVTVDEAALLLLAQQHGQLNFAPRNRESIEVSTSTKTTLRGVLENLEVIQEKRQIRIRKKPAKKMMAERTIEIIAGNSAVSAGVTALYNLAPPVNTESYDNPGQNHWVTTTQDRLSTFAADVDTGSFTLARRKLNEGRMPPRDSVRPEEWVNYFTYDYPQPTDGPFGVSLEAAPSPFQTDSNYRLFRVGVQGKSVESKERPPVHLTFLVDVSGSMNSEDKLGLAVKALKHLVGALQPTDTVALTTYAGRTETLLEPTTVARRGEIIAAIDRLRSGGGTAMNEGLQGAYALANEAFVKGHENRVIVLSDGDANVGRTSVDDMLATIAAGAERGITMSTIGFGMGNYKDDAMEQLANKGNGNYHYIDSFDEVRKVFGEQLNATLQTIARDVKLQVEFDPQAVKRYRLIGYENRDIADEDFRNDSVDAGEMGAGHSVTALYELEMADSNATTVATVRIRHRKPDNDGPTYETTAVMRTSDMAEKLAATSYSFRFAAAVAAFAEISRESPYAAHLNLEWVEEVATAAVAGKSDRAQLIELITQAKTLR